MWWILVGWFYFSCINLLHYNVTDICDSNNMLMSHGESAIKQDFSISQSVVGQNESWNYDC